MIRLLFSGTVALIGLTFLVGIGLPVNAQRLDEFGKGPWLKINGAMSLNQMAYFASGAPGRRDPYNFFLNAGLNLDLHGWVVPLSFSYSNQSKGAFQQPFNQLSLNPSYKWVNAQLGTQSMSLSGYTMNGHMFSGLGLELTPRGPWRINVLGGRFQRATNYLHDSDYATEPAYQRYGYGIKLSYAAAGQYDLVIFKAKDQKRSLESLPLAATIQPQDNLAIGVSFKRKVGKNVLFKGEVGMSALTNNLTLADSVVGGADLGFLLRSNSSTSLRRAIKSGIDYSAGRVVIGLGYERVDPEYKTLGSYYFNNDLQNITGNLSATLLDEKVNITLNAGVQNNDLKRDKQSQMKRLVGSMNLGLNLSSQLSFTGSYSNFQSYTNVRSTFQQINQLTPYDNLDTLNYRQISSNATFGATYVISKDQERTSVVNLSLAYFTSSDRQGGQVSNGGQFYNLNSTYSLNIAPKKISVLLGANINKSGSGELTSLTYGPTAGLSGSFLKKQLRNNLTVAWNQSQSNHAVTSRVLNARLGASYSYRKKHALNLALVFLDRPGSGMPASRGMNEYTATFGYQFSL